MSTLTLREDIGLDLSVTNSTTGYVTAAMVLRGMQIAIASASRDQVHVLADGAPCLAVGGAHFPLAFTHLKWAAATLGMSVRGVTA
jgi:hypothetical protein